MAHYDADVYCKKCGEYMFSVMPDDVRKNGEICMKCLKKMSRRKARTKSGKGETMHTHTGARTTLTLHNMILAVVEDNSGGIKFTELVAIIVKNALENGERLPDDFADEIERQIRASKDMQILEYTYKAANRLKMFVYTP